MAVTKYFFLGYLYYSCFQQAAQRHIKHVISLYLSYFHAGPQVEVRRVCSRTH